MAEIESQGNCPRCGTPKHIGCECSKINPEMSKEKALTRLTNALELAENAVRETPNVAPTAARIFREVSLPKAVAEGVDTSQIENFESRVKALYRIEIEAMPLKDLQESIANSPWTAALEKFDELVIETGSAGKASKYERNKVVEVDVDGRPAVGKIVKVEGSVYLLETEVDGQPMITLATEDELREFKH